MSDYTRERGVAFGYRTEGGNVRGERHSFRDFGLYPKDAPEMEAPEVNTSGIYVPGADGVIDTTDAMDGTVHYKNRKAVFTFFLAGPRDRWAETCHRLLRELHGRKRDILIDGDARGYYTGRLTVDKPKVDARSYLAYFTVRGDLKPYQYDFTETGEDWLWGPFRFAGDCYRRNYKTVRVPAVLSDIAEVTATAGDNPAANGWYERTGEAPDYVYTLTTDEEPVEDKTYWAETPKDYAAVTATAGDNPAENGWYERTGAAPDYVYTLTKDKTPVEGKTYFAAAGRMVIHPYARIKAGEVIFPLRASDLPVTPEITVTRQTDHVTGVRVRYVNVHRAAKDVTISSATPADSHPFSDLILCAQRAEVTEVKLSAVTSAGADGKDFAEIRINYKTGRL